MINFSFPEEVNIIFNALAVNGYEGYLVGGCVRDILIGNTPKDYDFAVSSLPKETTECFKEYKVIDTGLKHGTVMVKINDYLFELTTFRTEGEYLDLRHPSSVEFTSLLSEDLKRRDFTINAMAYNPSRGLIDLYGGKEDLNNKIIRCVGKPEERFSEDALRIMRALRFSSVLGFYIENNTINAIHSLKHLLTHISVERIYQELNKLILGTPDSVFNEFPDVFSVILPDFNLKTYINDTNKDRILRYALILNSTDSLKKLKADGETLKTLNELFLTEKKCLYNEAELLYHLGNLKHASCELAALYLQYTSDNYNYTKLLNSAVSEIKTGRCVSLKSLKINGSDLISQGFKSGIGIKNTLDTLLKEVIALKLKNERTELLCRAKEIGDNNET